MREKEGRESDSLWTFVRLYNTFAAVPQPYSRLEARRSAKEEKKQGSMSHVQIGAHHNRKRKVCEGWYQTGMKEIESYDSEVRRRSENRPMPQDCRDSICDRELPPQSAESRSLISWAVSTVAERARHRLATVLLRK